MVGHGVVLSRGFPSNDLFSCNQLVIRLKIRPELNNEFCSSFCEDCNEITNFQNKLK